MPGYGIVQDNVFQIPICVKGSIRIWVFIFIFRTLFLMGRNVRCPFNVTSVASEVKRELLAILGIKSQPRRL